MAQYQVQQNQGQAYDYYDYRVANPPERKRIRNMSYFRESSQVGQNSGKGTEMVTLAGIGSPEFFFEPDDINDIPQVMQFCIYQANYSDTHKERISAFASALALIFTGARDRIIGTLRSLGVDPRVTKIPSEIHLIEGADLDFEDEFDWPETVIYLGCCVLVLFKNINTDGYKGFMERRLDAMRAVIGIADSYNIEIPFKLENAKKFRDGFGAYPDLKCDIIRSFMKQVVGVGPIAHLSRYLATILAWSEMNTFTFIFETLLITKSPAIEDDRVRAEVRNVYFAYTEILKAEMPQFFKFFEGKHHPGILERARFPTLLSLAHRIKRDSMQSTTLLNFATISTEKLDSDLVRDLYEIHIHKHRYPRIARMHPVANFLAQDYMDDTLQQMNDLRDQDGQQVAGANAGGQNARAMN